MNSDQNYRPEQWDNRRHFSGGWLVFWCVLGWIALCVLGVVSMFQLSSEANALRGGVMQSVAGTWHKKIALNAGFVTFGLVRAGSHFFNLPPEARAAIKTVRGGEVGVYDLTDSPQLPNAATIVACADRAMARKGWSRAVGVSESGQLVLIYLPDKGFSSRRVRCCLMVLTERQLVVVSAKANLEPVIQLAQDYIKHPEKIQELANR